MLKVVILSNGTYFINIIRKLHTSYNIFVITHKLKPQGRGLHIPDNIITNFCHKNQIKYHEVENINTECNVLDDFKPDIILLCDFKDILKDYVIKIPKLFALNIHPSLLPLHRGTSPIQSCLLNGECYSGYSITEITHPIDTGKIYYQETVPVYEWDNFFTLKDRIFNKIENSILNIIKKIISKELIGIVQDEKRATYCKKLKKEDGKINWQDNALIIYRKMQAFKKWPGIYFYTKNNEKVEIVSANIRYLNLSDKSGMIADIKPFYCSIQTSSNILNIIKVKPEGKNIMTATDFLNGLRLKKYDYL